jgi:hypothetical protein
MADPETPKEAPMRVWIVAPLKNANWAGRQPVTRVVVRARAPAEAEPDILAVMTL